MGECELNSALTLFVELKNGYLYVLDEYRYPHELLNTVSMSSTVLHQWLTGSIDENVFGNTNTYWRVRKSFINSLDKLIQNHLYKGDDCFGIYEACLHLICHQQGLPTMKQILSLFFTFSDEVINFYGQYTPPKLVSFQVIEGGGNK
jgi:hypothetical protein